jgi:hypothetical protein
LRQLAKLHAAGRFIQLRNQVEARQRDVEAVTQPAADLVFDQRRAAEQTQLQTQFVLVIAGPFDRLGLASSGASPESAMSQSSPPAMVNVAPLMPLASPGHRKATAAATSSGAIRRPCGFCRVNSTRASSRVRPVFVATRAHQFGVGEPGHTVSTGTPPFATSSASDRARPATAYLAAQ